MAVQPRKIFVRARRIDDQQKFLLANPINDQVIDDAATLVQQKSVLTRANIELADVIVSMVLSHSRAPVPSPINCPMCEISKMPALFRTA